MRCPHCGHNKHKVIDTRDAADGIRRRRRCENCDQRFTTYEHVAASLLVVKSDGRREAYDRQKLLSGIQIAATKRPVSSDAIEHIVVQIEEALHSLGRSEVPSSMIGNLGQEIDGLKERIKKEDKTSEKTVTVSYRSGYSGSFDAWMLLLLAPVVWAVRRARQ